MKAGRRLWRTTEGALVGDGHADGVTLAYAAGDDLTAADQIKVAGAEDDSQEKARTAPNKSRRPQANKGGG